jgi:hypothetical protein
MGKALASANVSKPPSAEAVPGVERVAETQPSG